MRVLLDTHVLLWWLFDDDRLTADTEALIADRSNEILVSGASAFEIGVKKSIGKLDAPDDLPDQLAASGFTEMPVTVAHGLEVERLPFHHRDPFDRLLIAQARAEPVALLTFDRALAPYDYPRLPTP